MEWALCLAESAVAAELVELSDFLASQGAEAPAGIEEFGLPDHGLVIESDAEQVIVPAEQLFSTSTEAPASDPDFNAPSKDDARVLNPGNSDILEVPEDGRLPLDGSPMFIAPDVSTGTQVTNTSGSNPNRSRTEAEESEPQ